MLTNNYNEIIVFVLLVSLFLNIIMTLIIFFIFIRKKELNEAEIEKLL